MSKHKHNAQPSPPAANANAPAATEPVKKDEGGFMAWLTNLFAPAKPEVKKATGEARQSNMLLWAGGVVLLLIGIAAGVYYYIAQKSETK